MPPPNGLVAYYPFDGNAHDASLYQNHARERGTLSYAAGLAGQAASFNGTDAYVEAHDASWLHFGSGSFTVAAWVKTNGVSTAPLVDKGAPTLTAEGAFHTLVSTGAARLSIQSAASSGDYKDVRSTGSINDAAWHHVVATRDADNHLLKIYVDGAQAATPTSDSGIGSIDSTRSLLIGTDQSNTRFKGLIDEVYLYNRAISDAEVTALFGSCGTPPTPPCSNLVSYDANADFDTGWQNVQNPNGVWSYGWSTGATGSLHVYGDRTNNAVSTSVNVNAWYDAQNWKSNTPVVYRNTGSDYTSSGVTLDAGALILSPGGTNFTAYSQIVFTAPYDGLYYFAGGYYPQQSSINVDVSTRVDEWSVGAAALTASSQYSDFFHAYSLAQGNTVSFAVGPNYNTSVRGTATKVEARISACADSTGVTPTCSDTVRNQGETDIDCGGKNCGPCPLGGSCARGSDCASGFCKDDQCVDTSAYTVALFHFDGADGSTILTDSSSFNHVATIGGNPVISASQSEFGGSSLYVKGTSNEHINYVLFNAISSDFVFNADFTMDWWQWVVSYTDKYGMTVAASNSSPTAIDYSGSCTSGNSGAETIGYGWSSSGSSAPSVSTWHHIAITRSGTTVLTFVDGHLASTSTYSAALGGRYLLVSGAVCDAASDNGDLNGYIDELRVVNGVALWTTDFTPPTGPQP